MGAHEYITWPGREQHPGADLLPGWSKTAGDARVVHSHQRYCWVEEKDPQTLAITRLSQGVAQTALQTMQTATGAQVLYFDAISPDVLPGVPGMKPGMGARGRDPESQEIVSEWIWDGTRWQRAMISNATISNLDVGKLTAGSAEIAELVARNIAAAAGRFIQLDVSQLVASDARFSSAVADKLWADAVYGKLINSEKIVTRDMIADGAITAAKVTASEELTAKTAQFLRVNADMIEANAITASKISAGALDGTIITGTVLQTTKEDNRGVKFSAAGVQAWDTSGKQTLNLDGKDNRIVGQLSTSLPGTPGLVLRNQSARHKKPILFFTNDGRTDDQTAAIFLTDRTGALAIRNDMSQAGAILCRPGLIADQAIGVASAEMMDSYINGTTDDISPDLMISRQGCVIPANVYINATTALSMPKLKRGTFGANLGISSNPWGDVFWLSSARKYKLGIRDAQQDGIDPAALLTVHPRTWVDRGEAEDHALYCEDRAEGGAQSGKWDYAAKRPRRIPGLVAEEVEEAGLGLYVTYGEDGSTVEGLQYDRLWTLLIPLVKEQRERIQALEEQLNELKENAA